MERKWPFGRGGFGRTGGAAPSGNGKPTMDLSRGRLTAAERGLLHHLERLAATRPGQAFSEADLWSQYSAYADRARGNGRDLRAGFEQTLAGLAEHGLIEWRDGSVRLAP